jgi:hypothetical protein
LTAAHVAIKYVKSRVIAGLKFTDGTYAAYELTFNSKLTNSVMHTANNVDILDTSI